MRSLIRCMLPVRQGREGRGALPQEGSSTAGASCPGLKQAIHRMFHTPKFCLKTRLLFYIQIKKKPMKVTGLEDSALPTTPPSYC